MLIENFKYELSKSRKKLRRILSSDLVDSYKDDELDLMAFIFITAKDVNIALRVANHYRCNKKAS